jgi:hypothetical protein
MLRGDSCNIPEIDIIHGHSREHPKYYKQIYLSVSSPLRFCIEQGDALSPLPEKLL